MKVAARVFVLALAVTIVPGFLAWIGFWPAGLAAAVLAAVAAAFLIHRWAVAPLEELGRGLKRWALCDFEVPLDPRRMAVWPVLEEDFRKAQGAVSRALETQKRPFREPEA